MDTNGLTYSPLVREPLTCHHDLFARLRIVYANISGSIACQPSDLYYIRQFSLLGCWLVWNALIQLQRISTEGVKQKTEQHLQATKQISPSLPNLFTGMAIIKEELDEYWALVKQRGEDATPLTDELLDIHTSFIYLIQYADMLKEQGNPNE